MASQLFPCPAPACYNSVTAQDKFCRICGCNIYASTCDICCAKVPAGYTKCLPCCEQLITKLQQEAADLKLRLGISEQNRPNPNCPILG